MARIFTRIFSNAAVAARLPTAKPSVTIANTSKYLLRLDIGVEGRLTGLTVLQEETDGVHCAFTVDLYKSTLPWPLINQSFPTGDTPIDSPALYRVFPTKNGVISGVVELEDDSPGFAYRNMDGASTASPPYLYLLITPTAPGAITHWKVSVTVERDVG